MAGKKHTYDYAFDINGPTAPARAIRMAGRDKRILEIGAGPGSITRVLKHHAACEVTAIERDPLAMEHLAPHCRKLLPLDLNSADWPQALADEPDHDVILCTDVLEHLADPLATLLQIRTLLKPGACLVLSLPNTSHNAILATLHDHDFRYFDYGLLDRTHIRFFSLRNIQALLDDARLKIIAVEFVLLAPEETELADQWLKLPAGLRQALGQRQSGNIYQVVLKAVLPEAEGSPVDILEAASVVRHKIPLLRRIKTLLRQMLGADNMVRARAAMHHLQRIAGK